MDWKSGILSLLQWLESQGAEAIFWIILLQALWVLLAIPGPFFTMLAGFLFGIWSGLSIILVGSMLGSISAYAIARQIPRGKHIWKRPPGWTALLERFVTNGDWKTVLATRLIPFFPFKLSNYFFGWVRFPFHHFWVGTFLGIIPMTAVSVSAGSLASDLTQLLAGGGNGGGRWQWSLAGLAVALAVFGYAGYRGRRRLRELRAEDAP